MANSVKRQAPQLKTLCSCQPKDRRVLLKHADPELVRVICECALNVLEGNIPISSRDKKRLLRNKNLLRRLAGNRDSLPQKKRLIVQSGGSFLLALLPAVISLIGSALSR
jgi:hypothetical protein